MWKSDWKKEGESRLSRMLVSAVDVDCSSNFKQVQEEDWCIMMITSIHGRNFNILFTITDDQFK